jgi:hypothetical protein
MTVLSELSPHWPEVSALLDELLALPVAQRAGWLAQLSGDQAQLKAILGELLAGHTGVETGDFLGTLPKLGLSDGVRAADAEPQPDDSVGPYRLISELGQGGMGSVWLAERIDGQPKRKVALKLPRMAWGSGLSERLARERDILATLAHVNIARLYDAGIDKQGRPYLAMEHVDGQPIDVHSRERALPTRARIGLLLQVCDAVAHAHSRLVVHRDLKPSNILVTADGQVRLLDFGIAKLMEGDSAQETALTRLSGRALTLDYASPEQIRGEPLGTASDVYSLAVVAYELLAGTRPYRLKRGSAAELEEAIASADPPLASDAAIEPAPKKQLRGDLDAILNKGLKKDPNGRYPTAPAFADDLARALHGDVVLAQPDSRLYRLRKFTQRYRVIVVSASAVFAALTIGLGTALWQAQQARANEREAQISIEREDAVKDLYVETLSKLAAADAAQRAEPGTVNRMLVATLDDFETRYKESPERLLGLLEAVANQLPFMGDYAGSLDVSQRYQALLRQTAANDSRQLRAAAMTGRALENLNRPADAVVVLSQALAEWPDTFDARSNRPIVQADLGRMLGLLGQREEAEHVLADAVRAVVSEKALPSTLWNVNMSQARHFLGHDAPEALRLMVHAHDTYVRDTSAFPAQVGYSYQFIASGLSQMGRNVQAEQALAECLQRFEAMFGKNDRDTVIASSRLAAAVGAQGRYAEARQRLAERWADIFALPPSADARRAQSTLIMHSLENEVAHGDVQAANSLPSIEPADAASLAVAADKGTYLRSLVRSLLWSGRADEAARVSERWMASLAAHSRNGPDAHLIQLAMVEAALQRGQADAALALADTLIANMQKAGAVRTWAFREAHEWASLAHARGGASAAEAMARLLASERGVDPPAPGATSQSARADSLQRRGELLLAAGRREEAATAIRSLLQEIETQHPDSPRRAAANKLAAVLSPIKP